MGSIKLSTEYIQSALTTRFIGRPLYYHPAIGSTMDEARRLAETGANDGTVVLADEQSAGRARLQRSWWAPSGTSLLLTLLLRPTLPPRQAQRLTMICSLAACDALAQVGGVRAQVKWPNDVVVGSGSKLCGILTELEPRDDDKLNYVLVGIGINVNVDFSSAPPLLAPATSLLEETGHFVSRLSLLAALLANIEDRYVALQAGASFHEEWGARMATVGQAVQVSDTETAIEGIAVGVDENGALLIQTADGAVQRVLAGDVTLRGH